MRRHSVLLALVLISATALPTAFAGGEKKVDVPGISKVLATLMKRKDLPRKEADEAQRKIDALTEEEVASLLESLAAIGDKDRGAAAPDVLRLVDEALLGKRWSPGVLRLPDAGKRFDAAKSDAAVCTLLADLSRLPDPEPATRFGLLHAASPSIHVRLRAVDVLADLASWGGEGARILPVLLKALDDASPGVRDLALERLANLSEPSVLDWSIAHFGEPASEEVEIHEKKEVRCPGVRAMEILSRASKLHYGVDLETFTALNEENRKAFLDEYRDWRSKAGSNPLRAGDEGPFDPQPKVVSVVIDPIKSPNATVRWWSEVDRAQFRLDLDEMDVTAFSKIDWSANFHLTVIASGAREGNWEAFAKKIRCGARHRLPRRGFGLIETSIQQLLDGKWKIWVHAFEYRGK